MRISLLEGCRAPCLPISSVAGDAVATIGQAAAVMIVVSHLDLDHLAARCSANVSEAFPLFTYYFHSISIVFSMITSVLFPITSYHDSPTNLLSSDFSAAFPLVWVSKATS